MLSRIYFRQTSFCIPRDPLYSIQELLHSAINILHSLNYLTLQSLFYTAYQLNVSMEFGQHLE